LLLLLLLLLLCQSQKLCADGANGANGDAAKKDAPSSRIQI
jgi:hypothetical protein